MFAHVHASLYLGAFISFFIELKRVINSDSLQIQFGKVNLNSDRVIRIFLGL